MNKEQLKNEIAILLEAITEQYESIYKYGERIPQIEMDIILSNVRQLYERLIQLNKDHHQTTEPTKPKADLSKLSSPDIITAAVGSVKNVVDKKQVIEKIQNAPDIISVDEKIIVAIENTIDEVKNINHPIPTIEEVKPAVSVETKSEFKSPVIENIQEKIAVEVSKEEEQRQLSPKPKKQVISLFDSPATISQQYEGKQSVKDKINSSKNEKSVADKLHHHKISDLKSAIGINEKFSFINELFDGMMNAYNESIEKINSCENFESALQYIDSLISKYNWSTDTAGYKKFIDFVERRFI